MSLRFPGLCVIHFRVRVSTFAIKDRMLADKNTKIVEKGQNYWKKRKFFNIFLEVTDFFIIFAARNFHSL